MASSDQWPEEWSTPPAGRAALPRIEFAFPGPLRDRLVRAILDGSKSATSSLLREYDVGEDAMPAIGDRGVVVDSHGRPAAVIEVTDVRVVALRDVPVEHAVAEGEGYSSVDQWRRGHEAFWRSAPMREELGRDFELSDDTGVVLERFVVLASPADETAAGQGTGHG